MPRPIPDAPPVTIAARSVYVSIDRWPALRKRPLRIGIRSVYERSPGPVSGRQVRMKAVLRSLQSDRDQRLDGVRGTVDEDRQFLALGSAEVLEREVGGILSS